MESDRGQIAFFKESMPLKRREMVGKGRYRYDTGYGESTGEYGK